MTGDLPDIPTQSYNLCQLLDVLYEQATELQYVRPNGERDIAADRVTSLLILARDEARRLDEAIDGCNRARQVRP